jgi:hypothetical protein
MVYPLHSPLERGERLKLGDHDVAKSLSGRTDNRRHVLFESRMVDRVNAYRHPGPAAARISRRPRQVSSSQVCHHQSMVMLTANRRTVLAVERYIKGAGTELLGHRGLQGQTFAHPGFDATVVITNRNWAAHALRAKEHVTRCLHG